MVPEDADEATTVKDRDMDLSLSTSRVGRVAEDADAATTVKDRDMDLSLSTSRVGMVPEDADADAVATREAMNTNKVIASPESLFAGIPVRTWRIIAETWRRSWLT